MNNDTRELIIELCTRIGMLMKDVSSIALRIGPVEDDNLIAHLKRFNETTARIGQLIDPCFAHSDE